jgi:hypothetical protein
VSATKKIAGPFEVMNIASNGQPPVYEVIEIINEKRDYESLRPRRTYINRQSAYGMMARLNRRWQEDHAMDEPEDDYIEEEDE